MILTLDELMNNLKKEVKFKDQCKELYRQVACGERHPTKPPLPDSVVILACQYMYCFMEHVDKENTEDCYKEFI